jgi:uncharacterized protein (DUF433 family)
MGAAERLSTERTDQPMKFWPCDYPKLRGRFEYDDDGSQRTKGVCMEMPEEAIVSDPEILGGMPVIKGTRVLVYDVAASVKAGISRDRILSAYPTIKEHDLDLAVAYAEANPLQGRDRRFPTVTGATLVKCGQIPRRKGCWSNHRT